MSNRRGKLGSLTLAALGIVYGDIGTSPLYAVRECFYGESRLPVTADSSTRFPLSRLCRTKQDDPLVLVTRVKKVE